MIGKTWAWLCQLWATCPLELIAFFGFGAFVLIIGLFMDSAYWRGYNNGFADAQATFRAFHRHRERRY